MNEISDVAKKKIEEAVASYPKKWTHGVCAGYSIHRNTGENRWGDWNTGYVCHNPINSLDNSFIVVNAHKPKWFKQNPEFVKWTLFEAPFNHGVINKEDEKALFGQASVIDLAKVGKGGALWVCKALRHFKEDVWVPDVWDQLRNEGLTGLQAFIGADILNKDGSPKNGTHVSLFKYGPPSELRKIYDTILGLKRIDTSQATVGFRNGYDPHETGPVWGTIKCSIEKKPDGWGGYTEIQKPGCAKEYAALLKEIFEGDPKNVS